MSNHAKRGREALEGLLPANLLASAIMLVGEMSWPRDDAIRVVAWSTEAGWPVVGVETWHRVGEYPRWIASSRYPDTTGDRFGRAIAAAEHAKGFIELYRADASALFNLTWDLSANDD